MTTKEDEQPEVRQITVRGWKNGILEFCEAHTFTGNCNTEGESYEAMAERHATRLMDAPHLIEIEFMDEPDREKRFMRLGTDPTGMVDPQPADFVLPFECEGCGANLAGGDTDHKPDCPITKLIHEVATAAREAGLDPRQRKKPSVH